MKKPEDDFSKPSPDLPKPSLARSKPSLHRTVFTAPLSPPLSYGLEPAYRCGCGDCRSQHSDVHEGWGNNQSSSEACGKPPEGSTSGNNTGPTPCGRKHGWERILLPSYSCSCSSYWFYNHKDTEYQWNYLTCRHLLPTLTDHNGLKLRSTDKQTARAAYLCHVILRACLKIALCHVEQAKRSRNISPILFRCVVRSLDDARDDRVNGISNKFLNY